MEDENVTIRKQQLSNSLENICTMNSNLFDATITSLPNTSLNESQTVIDLNETIRKLTLELQSAHQEIENLNSVNSQLKTDVEKYQKVIETYKKVQFSKIKPHTPLSKNKKIKIDYIATPTRIHSPFNLSTPKPTEKNDNNYLHNTSNTESIYITPTTNREQDIVPEANKQQQRLTSKNPNIPVTYQTENNKNKVIILADHQGWKIRELLQKLIGSSYIVTSFWKPGARMEELLKSLNENVQKLTMNDYVIIIGGTNDCNPHEFKFSIENWCRTMSNTNIIITEIPSNRYLNERKLNYELRFISNNFTNVKYMDVNYRSTLPHGIHFPINLSRLLLRQILNIDNKRKYLNYQLQLQSHHEMKCQKSTQTDSFCDHKLAEMSFTNETELSDDFFRK